MKTFKQFAVFALVLIQSIGFSQNNHLQKVSNKYDALLKEQKKGIAVLVKKGNKTKTLSLGNFNLTAESVFNIGSATKTFTAILILQEMEKGNLKLSDSIGTYITPIPNVDGTLTIKDLLTHQSGVSEVIGRNILDMFYAKNDSLYSVNLLHQVKKNNPDKVGTFSYSNTNYFLLGKLLENVTDQNYFDLLRERIFTPLNMKASYPYVHKNLPNLAKPYHNGKDVSEYLDHRFFSNIAYAAGSIASTLNDMEQFYTALFETEKLIKNETLQMMLSSGNEMYGLGIFKSNHDGTFYYGHGGNNIGYAFSNGYNPKSKELYLLFSNEMAIPVNSIEDDLIAYLEDKEISNFEAVDIDSFKGYVGSYLVKEAGLVLKIEIENNKLFLVSEAQGIKSVLNQKDKNTLIEKTTGVTLSLIAGSDDSLTFSQSGFTTTISKVQPSTKD